MGQQRLPRHTFALSSSLAPLSEMDSDTYSPVRHWLDELPVTLLAPPDIMGRPQTVLPKRMASNSADYTSSSKKSTPLLSCSEDGLTWGHVSPLSSQPVQDLAKYLLEPVELEDSEVKKLKVIAARAESCNARNVCESTWSCEVVRPLLDLAVRQKGPLWVLQP